MTLVCFIAATLLLVHVAAWRTHGFAFASKVLDLMVVGRATLHFPRF